MTRLDQLSKPFRRNGEHICAILERERRKAMDLENLSKASLTQASPSSDKRKSRSMSQLNGRIKSRDNSRTRQNRLVSSPLQRHIKNTETTRSMTLLSGNNDKKSSSATATPSKSGWINALKNHNGIKKIYNLRLEAGFRCNAISFYNYSTLP